MTQFRWKEGPPVGGLDAQVVGEELERIRTANGGKLTSKAVLDAASSRKSPLHKWFEWRDGKAAQSWRLEQAGQLIRSVEVAVEVQQGGKRNLRAFVSVKRGKDRSYTSIEDAMSDDELRAQVLGDALRELQAWRARYSSLSEFAKVHAAIDKTLKSRRAA